LLWDAGPGDLLGDLGVLGPSPGAATVTAVSPMRLLSLSPRAADVVFDLPGVARWAFAQLDRRLRELTCAPAAYETKPEVVAALTTQAFEVPAPA
jgi:CRP-like cAMP-binding protein